MKMHRLKALVYMDFKILSRAKWRLVETIYFPITTIIIWGFFALYSKEIALEAGLIVLAINIFWNFAYIAQSTANMQIMEDLWAGSLKQILLSGITEFEYIVARLFTATIISIIVMILILGISALFMPSMLAQPLYLAMLAGITLIGSLALSVIIAAINVSAGREYGFIAWTALQLFILLSAPFNPIEIFPKFLQYIALFMPFTFVFESARSLATAGVINPAVLSKSFFVSVAYFIIGWPIYYLAFKRARKTGILARMS